MDFDTWKLQDVKARLSHVVRKCTSKPQRVTRHGEEAAYVVSPAVFHEYELLKQMTLTSGAKNKIKPKTFGDLMKTFPKGIDLSELIGPRSTIARATDDKLFD